MKTYVSTDYNGCKYITAGKLYEVIMEGRDKRGFNFIDDNLMERYSFYEGSKLHLENGSWTTHEVGTLAELNVKAGDVVELVEHKDSMLMGHATVDESGDARMKDGRLFKAEYDEEFGRKFRIISRADTTPKTWGEMTDAEKGAIALAKCEGKPIEILMTIGKYWREIEPQENTHFYSGSAYRIKPEPKRESVEFGYSSEFGLEDMVDGTSTHRITFDTIDGKPDCDSVKMEAM